MQTAREMFLHELKDMLDAENQLVAALDEMANESTRPELEKAFNSHRKQTENHARRLEQVFKELGEEPETTDCKGIQGLKEEKESFTEEDPSDELLDIFNVGAGIKTERYEISSYESLVHLAKELDLRKGIVLLQQNLREEEETLRKLQGFSKKMKPSMTGIEEVEERTSRRKGQRRSTHRVSAA